MYPDADHRPNSDRHPGMHKTQTVDYAILLEGEIVALLDEGEKVMRAGDVLVQRGTMHAGANRSGRTAKMAFILIAPENFAGAWKSSMPITEGCSRRWASFSIEFPCSEPGLGMGSPFASQILGLLWGPTRWAGMRHYRSDLVVSDSFMFMA